MRRPRDGVIDTFFFFCCRRRRRSFSPYGADRFDWPRGQRRRGLHFVRGVSSRRWVDSNRNRLGSSSSRLSISFFLLAGSFFSLDRVRSYVRSGKTPQGKSFCLFQTVLFISNDVDSAQVFRFFRVFHFFLPFHATGFWSTFIKGKQSSLRLQSVIRFFFQFQQSLAQIKVGFEKQMRPILDQLEFIRMTARKNVLHATHF